MLKDIIEGLWHGWIVLCVVLVTVFLVLMVLFGGEFHASINWNSWNELIKHFKRD